MAMQRSHRTPAARLQKNDEQEHPKEQKAKQK